MIATVEGRLAQKGQDSLLISIGGVGIEVSAPFSTIQKLDGERVFLYTRLVLREDSLTLYGFASTAERALFDALIKISGIGPKLALSALSTLSVDNIRNAVREERPEILSRVPGIGKKTAQKILLELQDKFPPDPEAAPVALADDSSAEVMDALTALGYSIVEAQAALQSIPLDGPETVEERVFIALRYLGA